MSRPLMSGLAGSIALAMTATSVSAAPPIRISGANAIPHCVTPERLMAFLKTRNQTLDPRYRDIARWYQYWGEKFRVRWDYAFYQMALETNYLKYRRGNGRRGDVHEKQNNFAGIGATGGGVAGDRFPDIKTGVQAQFQHLVAYSGEHVEAPVARRTRENQDEIIAKSKRLNRAVTFGDLARRWAADRQYAKSIDVVADQFRTGHCSSPLVDAGVRGITPFFAVPIAAVAHTSGARKSFAKPSGLGGPEPLRLAGPADDLPWADAQAPATDAVPPKTNAAQPSEPAKKKKLPVRTIWSRDGKIDPVPDPTDIKNKAAVERAPTPQPAAEPSKATTAAPPSAEPVAAAATPAPVQTLAAPATAAIKDEAPILPTFRIEPLGPEPSRLGGPVPQLLKAPEVATRTPRASFKEIIGAPEARLAARAQRSPCRIVTASYGGTKTLLVRTAFANETRLTALTVLDGFEKSMFDTYAKANGGGGEVIGEYPSKDDALTDARVNCSGG